MQTMCQPALLLVAMLVPQARSQSALLEHWRNHPPSDYYLDRWVHYAPHYEQHLPARDNGSPLRMLEIGVSSGGSAIAWKRWYGPSLTYVGVDLNPACKRTESVGERRYIEIGSQEDPDFLRSICAKYGPFDIVIDDGAHIARMVQLSLQLLFESDQCMRDKSIYVIEDLHVLARCSGPGHDSTFCNHPRDFSSLYSDAFLGMHNRWQGCNQAGRRCHRAPKTRPLGPSWASMVAGVHLYDSMAFFERNSGQNATVLGRLTRGNRTERITTIDPKVG